MNNMPVNTPIMPNHFRKYIALNFDNGSLSLYEQVREAVEKLNELGEISNELYKRWNDVFTWIHGEGLKSVVEVILNKWYDEGLLDDMLIKIIGLIGDLNDFREFDKLLITKMKNEFTEDRLNVKWFGAIGDGQKDDFLALQTAIDTCNRLGGGDVMLPHGEYRITQPLRIKSGVNLHGKGSLMWLQPDKRRTNIILDSENNEHVAIDFRGTLVNGGGYPNKIMFVGDLKQVNAVYGASLNNLHVTNRNRLNVRNSCGVMFNACPTCHLENVSIDGDFEIALVSVASWFTSIKQVYAKAYYIGAYVHGMNASHIDMLLVGARNAEFEFNPLLNVYHPQYVDRSVGLYCRNSPGISFTALTAEYSYNGLLFVQSGPIDINGLYIENVTKLGFSAQQKSYPIITGGHALAVPKLFKILDASNVTSTMLNGTDTLQMIDAIDDYSNLFITNERFPKLYHKRLKYTGMFNTNLIIVDATNGVDNQSGLYYNDANFYPVKTLGKAIEIAELSEHTDITIQLLGGNTYTSDSITRTLTKNYSFVKRGSASNPVILQNSVTSKPISVDGSKLTFSNVNITNQNTSVASTEQGFFYVLTSTVSMTFKNCVIAVGTHGLIQPYYASGSSCMLAFSVCTLTGDWLVSRAPTGAGTMVLIETSASTALSSQMTSNGIPTGIKFLSSTLFNR